MKLLINPCSVLWMSWAAWKTVRLRISLWVYKFKYWQYPQSVFGRQNERWMWERKGMSSYIFHVRFSVQWPLEMFSFGLTPLGFPVLTPKYYCFLWQTAQKLSDSLGLNSAQPEDHLWKDWRSQWEVGDMGWDGARVLKIKISGRFSW